MAKKCLLETKKFSFFKPNRIFLFENSKIFEFLAPKLINIKSNFQFNIQNSMFQSSDFGRENSNILEILFCVKIGNATFLAIFKHCAIVEKIIYPFKEFRNIAFYVKIVNAIFLIILKRCAIVEKIIYPFIFKQLFGKREGQLESSLGNLLELCRSSSIKSCKSSILH